MSPNPAWSSSSISPEGDMRGPTYALVGASKQYPRRIELAEISDLFPVPESPEDIDPLCLYQACRSFIDYFYWGIEDFAEQYEMPEELLTRVVVDWVISRLMGVEPTPTKFFIPERGKNR